MYVRFYFDPVISGGVDYRFTAAWAFSRYEGTLVRYEYMSDPPAVFSDGEVLNPEDYPGISIQVFPGPAADRDTLRISKSVGDTTYSFDWIQTPDTTQAFIFSAPYPDSVLAGSTMKPVSHYFGEHKIGVRAMRTDGSYGGAVSSLKVVNTTPVATIDRPLLGGILVVRDTIRVVWSGEDADTPDSPVGYLYKLLRVDTLVPKPRLSLVPASYLFSQDGPWTYVSADTDTIDLALQYGGEYLFGVRAVDADGAVEPFLDLDRNAFKFMSQENSGVPFIALLDPVMGQITGSGTGITGDRTIPQGVTLHVGVACTGEDYGGICNGIRWGLDLADPGEAAGWSPWEDLDVLPPIRFDEPGDHVLYVEAQDEFGAFSRVTVALHVIHMAFDRSVLWVDDFKNYDSPYFVYSDQAVDAFWRALFDNSNRFGASPGDSVWTYNAYGLNDVQHLPPVPPDLDFMGRFRLIIWYADIGYNGLSALYQSTGYQNRNLQAYLAAGGQLWVVGSQTVADMMRGGTNAPNSYPLEPSVGDFAYDFMKLASNRIENALAGNRPAPGGTSPYDNLIGVEPFPGKPAVYPAMQQDSTRWNPFAKSIPFADAVFDPILEDDIPGFTGVLDSLYIYKAVKASSAYNNRLTAIRWHDPNPNPTRGAIQWFGFDPYWMKTAQAQEVFNRSIDWFRSAEQPVPVRLSSFTVTRAPEGAVIRWSVAAATDHAGFDVYRQVGGGERVKLNDRLLSGSADYTFVDGQPPGGAATYWLAKLSRTGGTTWLGPVSLPAAEARFALAMSPAAPNPFRGATRITYTLPRATPVRVDVFDVQGRRVAMLVDETEPAGAHEVSWDGRLATGARAAAGFYLIHLKAGDSSLIRKVLLLG